MALSLAKLRSVLALAMYLALVLSILAVSPAAAEDLATYPSATIRIIVPYPAGGHRRCAPEDYWRPAAGTLETIRHHYQSTGGGR